MRKTATISFHVTPAWKAKAEALALAKGKTVSAFVYEILDEALKGRVAPSSRPTLRLFRAQAVQAKKQPGVGYKRTGRILGAVARTHANAGVLGEMISRGDKKAAWAWFCENYAEEAKLIPARTERRRSFLRGVFDEWTAKPAV